MPVDAPPRTTWTSLHVRCDASTDHLLRDVVGPWANTLVRSGEALGWFFLRYWEQGPHVRLRLRTPASADPELLRRRLADRVASWAARNPLVHRYSAAQFEDLSRRFARREKVGEVVHALRDHADVWQQEYRPETGKYGQGAQLAAFERHFEQSSALAIGVLGTDAPRRHRWTEGLAVLVATWYLLERRHPDRSDPHEVLVEPWTRGTGAVEFAGTTPSASPGAVARLAALALRAVDRQPDAPDLLSTWTESVAPLLAPPTAERLAAVDICAHLWCNRIGLSLEEELQLRRTAAAHVALGAQHLGGDRD